MKIGDMVKWTPDSLTTPLSKDESAGLVLDFKGGYGVKGEGSWVLIWFADETKPRWRAHSNLEVISEAG